MSLPAYSAYSVDANGMNSNILNSCIMTRTRTREYSASVSTGQSFGNRRVILALFAAIVTSGSASSTPAASVTPQTPAAVFARIGPSLALVESEEVRGSGVVLSRTGLIATTYTTGYSLVPLKVTAEVMVRGKRARQTFDKVKLVGVHMQYDLALIKVEAPHVSFIPTALQPPPGPVATGSACYQVANSLTSEKSDAPAIAESIVSASDRNISGLAHIQIGSMVNPGQQGGALCDTRGKLIGILVINGQNEEGLGFAVPVSAIQKSAFTTVDKRKTDREAGARYTELGHDFFRLCQKSAAATRVQQLAMALLFYRQAICEMPGDATAYHNVGATYLQIREYKLAIPYLQKVIELDTSNALGCSLLGLAFDHLNKKEQALEAWMKGVIREADKNGAAACAENIAVYKLKSEDYERAAYFVRWGELLATRPETRDARNRVSTATAERLNAAQTRHLASMQKGSLEDLTSFVRLSGRAATAPTALASSRPAMSPAGRIRVMLAAGQQPTRSGITKALPGAVARIQPALYGTVAILQIDELGRLGVFNVPEVKFDKYIPFDKENSRFAAGGAFLVIYRTDQNVIEKWDLTSLKKVGNTPCGIRGKLTHFEMGWQNGQQAFVGWVDEDTPRGACHFALLDTQTGEFRSVHLSQRSQMRRYDRPSVHVIGKAQSFLMWRGGSPSGLYFVSSKGTGWEDSYVHKSFGGLSMAYDGKSVLTGRGQVVDVKGTVIKAHHESSLLPVYGGHYYMQLEDRGKYLNVRKLSDHSLVRAIEVARGGIVASAPINRVAVIQSKSRKIVVHDLGLKGKPPADSVVPVQTAQELWQHTIERPSGATVTIASGPEGLKYDPETGTLSWQTGQVERAGELEILLLVTLKDGNEDYMIVPIELE